MLGVGERYVGFLLNLILLFKFVYGILLDDLVDLFMIVFVIEF